MYIGYVCIIISLLMVQCLSLNVCVCVSKSASERKERVREGESGNQLCSERRKRVPEFISSRLSHRPQPLREVNHHTTTRLWESPHSHHNSSS